MSHKSISVIISLSQTILPQYIIISVSEKLNNFETIAKNWNKISLKIFYWNNRKEIIELVREIEKKSYFADYIANDFFNLGEISISNKIKYVGKYYKMISNNLYENIFHLDKISSNFYR